MSVQKNRFAYMSQSSFQLNIGGRGKFNFSANVTGSKTVKAALNIYQCFCCLNTIVSSRRDSLVATVNGNVLGVFHVTCGLNFAYVITHKRQKQSVSGSLTIVEGGQ